MDDSPLQKTFRVKMVPKGKEGQTNVTYPQEEYIVTVNEGKIADIKHVEWHKFLPKPGPKFVYPQGEGSEGDAIHRMKPSTDDP
jgi:hypothetical protein